MAEESARRPKHQEILNTLLAEIEAGVYQPGQQIPTEFALADRFEVSRPTAARAVLELVRLGLVTRRAGHGTFLCPRPDNGNRTFGILAAGDSEIFEPMCGFIARYVQGYGHSIHWADSRAVDASLPMESHPEAACQELVENGVSGVFLAPFVPDQETRNPNRRILQTLSEAGIQVVLLDRDVVQFPDRSQYDLVTLDHLRAQAQLTHHLVQRGFRTIVFWGKPGMASTIRQRLAGMRSVLLQAGLECRDDVLRICNPDDERQVRRLFQQQQPDAIMCVDDVFAGRLLRCLESLSIRIPDDVAVAGYDDVRYSDLLRVPLTTVSQPCEALGTIAVRLMMERIQAPGLPAREVLLAPELSIRESTGSSHVSR